MKICVLFVKTFSFFNSFFPLLLMNYASLFLHHRLLFPFLWHPTHFSFFWFSLFFELRLRALLYWVWSGLSLSFIYFSKYIFFFLLFHITLIFSPSFEILSLFSFITFLGFNGDGLFCIWFLLLSFPLFLILFHYILI